MYGQSYTTQAAANSYQTIDVQTASPARLISLLFNTLEARLKTAQQMAADGSPNVVGPLGKALDIVAELQNVLDLHQGGELAANLLNLYGYIGQRLRQSDNRVAAIVEVRKLIQPLASAWNELAEKGTEEPARLQMQVA